MKIDDIKCTNLATGEDQDLSAMSGADKLALLVTLSSQLYDTGDEALKPLYVLFTTVLGSVSKAAGDAFLADMHDHNLVSVKAKYTMDIIGLTPKSDAPDTAHNNRVDNVGGFTEEEKRMLQASMRQGPSGVTH